MFVINIVSGAMMVIAVVVLFVGLIYSSIRNEHDLRYHVVHNLTNYSTYYQIIIDDPHWGSIIGMNCHSSVDRIWGEWYRFTCHNTKFISEIIELEQEYHQRQYDGMVIKLIYVSVFTLFSILAILVGRLYGRWLELNSVSHTDYTPI